MTTTTNPCFRHVPCDMCSSGPQPGFVGPYRCPICGGDGCVLELGKRTTWGHIVMWVIYGWAMVLCTYILVLWVTGGVE